MENKKLEAFATLVTAQPEALLSRAKESRQQGLEVLRTLFAFTKNREPKGVETPLGELVVDGFDIEQIWEELHMQSEPLLNYIESVSKSFRKSDFSQTRARAPALGAGSPSEENEPDLDGSDDDKDASEGKFGAEADSGSDKDGDAGDNNSLENDADGEGDDRDDGDDGEDADEADQSSKGVAAKKAAGRKSVVDDKFFKMSEMEAFLKQGETADDAGDDDISAYLFGDGGADDDEDDDVDAAEARYEDFFEGDGGAGDGDDNVDDDDEDDDDDSPVRGGDLLEDDDDEAAPGAKRGSRFEHEQTEIKKRIRALEAFNIGDKPWQLAGEAAARDRPLNSLLETDLTVDYVSRAAPEITQEYSGTMEDIIKRRIKDQLWDDVERKTRTADEPSAPQVQLDSEKSKQGLGEIYEQKFMESTGAVPTAAEQETDAAHKEIEMLFEDLEQNLNALTNFHYTPGRARQDLSVVANVPSVRMEEATPMALSDATRLAPEEIINKPKGDVIADSERTDTDRKRARRKKKAAKRAALQEVAAKTGKQPSRVVKTKDGKNKKDKGRTDEAPKTKLSSSKFFQALQAQTDAAKAGVAAPKTKAKSGASGSSLRL